MKSTFLTAILCVLLGTSYGTSLKLDAIPVTITETMGWKLVQEDYGIVVLGHDSIPGMILLAENGYKNKTAAMADMSAGLEEEGLLLQGTEPVKELKNGLLHLKLSGLAEGYQPISGLAITKMSPVWGRGGVTAIVIANTNLWSKRHEVSAQKIMQGIRFYQPSKSTEWHNKLNQKQLIYRDYYSTSDVGFEGSIGAGYSELITIDFCRTGTFLYQRQMNTSASTGDGSLDESMTGSNQNGEKGWWSVIVVRQQPVVRLVYDNGEVNYYAITYQNGYIFANEMKFTIGASSRCQ